MSQLEVDPSWFDSAVYWLTNSILKDDVMYQWKRSESVNKQNASSCGTPGKIEFKINAQNGDDNR